DFIEEFIRKDYDFEGASFKHTDSNKLLNHFYRQMNKLFHKDLFARVRTGKPIIINQDTKDKTFFYYKTGFMEVDASGYRVRSFEKDLEGSVWETQMKDFNITELNFTDPSSTLGQWGMFADFMWKIAGQDPSRFRSLM